MATWIVHLRIAENLLAHLDLDPHNFAMGNVAPDSGVPDEKWEKFEPPTEVTHFRKPAKNPWPSSADLDFYRRFLAKVDPVAEQEKYSFLLGYFFHLVTDNLWASQIHTPTKERFIKEFTEKPDFIWEVKRDWYGLDFEYIRQHPNSLFWRVFLDCQYSGNFLDFLPPHAIQRNLDYIKEFYQRTDEEVETHFIQHPGIYLSDEKMDSFVEKTTHNLLEITVLINTGEIQEYNWSSILESCA